MFFFLTTSCNLGHANVLSLKAASTFPKGLLTLKPALFVELHSPSLLQKLCLSNCYWLGHSSPGSFVARWQNKFSNKFNKKSPKTHHFYSIVQKCSIKKSVFTESSVITKYWWTMQQSKKFWQHISGKIMEQKQRIPWGNKPFAAEVRRRKLNIFRKWKNHGNEIFAEPSVWVKCSSFLYTSESERRELLEKKVRYTCARKIHAWLQKSFHFRNRVGGNISWKANIEPYLNWNICAPSHLHLSLHQQ